MEDEQKIREIYPLIPSKYQPSHLNSKYYEQTRFTIQIDQKYGSKFLTIHPNTVDYKQVFKKTPVYGGIDPYTEMFVTGRIPTKERIEAYDKIKPWEPIGYIKNVENDMSIIISVEDWRQIKNFFSEHLFICFKSVLDYAPKKRINFEKCEILSAQPTQSGNNNTAVIVKIIFVDIKYGAENEE